MALYEYRCSDCFHGFETRQSMRDEAHTDCPECNEPTLRRVMFGNVTPSSTPTRMNSVPPRRQEPSWEKGRAGEYRSDGSFAPYLRPDDGTTMGVKEFADNRGKYEKKIREVRAGKF